MKRLTQCHDQLTQALETICTALNAFQALIKKNSPYNPTMTYEDEYRTYRDSLIQRFEYSIDLLWKYLKRYCELNDITIDNPIPSEIIRKAHILSLITEGEAETILLMIKSRNRTSHMYHEELAEQLAHDLPQFYVVLNSVAKRLTPRK